MKCKLCPSGAILVPDILFLYSSCACCFWPKGISKSNETSICVIVYALEIEMTFKTKQTYLEDHPGNNSDLFEIEINTSFYSD